MKFGPSKGNALIIFENFVRNFGLLALAIAAAIWKGPEILFSNGQILVIVLISPISTLIKYLFTKYSIDDEKMVIDSGFFVKKTMEIPLKGITTVDLSQNLLFQLFQVYKIKVDNSSQTNDTANKAELVLALKKETAFYVKSLLEAKNENTPEESAKADFKTIKPSITCSLSDFILLGALQSKFLYFITIVTTVCGGGGYIYSALSEQFNVSGLLQKFLEVLSPVIGITILVLTAYLISVAASIFVTAIRYYSYSVTNREDALLVQYGLFTKKSYTLIKKKISGITIKQSLLMRLFKLCTVEVFIIGYGDKSEDNQQELSLLYPIAKLNQVNAVLEELLPDMSFEREYHKRPKGSLPYFFYCFRMYLSIGILVGSIITVSIIKLPIPAPIIIGASLLYLILTILSVYLEYYNSGIYTNERIVSICKGIFSYNMVFIKAIKLESVTEQTTIWKRKHGFTNINLGFIAPTRVAHMKARNITYQDVEKVQKALSF